MALTRAPTSDAPRHFIPEGEAASELSLEPLIGPCAVVDATGESGPLGRAAVAALDIPAGIERVLLKTSNSTLWERDTFEANFARLNAEGADELVDRGDYFLVCLPLKIAGSDGAPARALRWSAMR